MASEEHKERKPLRKLLETSKNMLLLQGSGKLLHAERPWMHERCEDDEGLKAVGFYIKVTLGCVARVQKNPPEG